MNLAPLLLLPLTAAAVPPPAPCPPPVPLPSPFLAVRFVTAPGVKVTYYPGTSAAKAVEASVPVGLRPGYCYRLQVSDIPGRPGVALFPSIEVRGSLACHPPCLNPAVHPVPIILSADEIDRILRGVMITKVIFLEDPEKAVNLATTPEMPLEFAAASEELAIREARQRGRLVLILRVGERPMMPDELARENVPNTVLFPGMQALGPPPVPPALPYCGIPLYDPILGPKPPTEECLHDGGDTRRPLGVAPDGSLYGLDPSDTSIEYTTPKGRRVCTSNRVCICVPRFVALRVEVAPEGHLEIRGPEGRYVYAGQTAVKTRVPPQLVLKPEQPVGMQSRLRPSATVGEKGPFAFEQVIGKPQAVGQIAGTQVVARLLGPGEMTGYPCKMVLVKWMEPKCPQQIGEEVTFFLRYQNPGSQPITQVVVSDSLTTRLEYVPGSASSERAATFTVAPNEAGSVILRWELADPLLPGESGVVSFRARIR